MLEFIKNQLEELLTGYGPIVQLWFDGFWNRQQSGWVNDPESTNQDDAEPVDRKKREEDFISAWRMEGAFRWQMDHMYDFVKSLQPDCIIMNNSTSSYKGVPLFPVDARNGERYKDLENDRKIWQWLGEDVFMPLQIETTLSTKGNQRFPSGNWFWHDWDHSVLPKDEVQNYLAAAKKLAANLLLNVGLTDEGILRDEDAQLLRNLYD